MIKRFLVSGDWHMGAISPADFVSQLREVLDIKLKELLDEGGKLDYLMICGDVFDSKQYFASDVTKCIMQFFNNLLCEYSSIISNIIFINGTRTHDAGQLDNLWYIISNSYDVISEEINVIMYYGVNEYLDDEDLSMLIIPEEYVNDQDAHYGKYLDKNKRYDFIFGHGMIDKVWYAKQDKELYGASQITSAPVFKLEDLTDICDNVMFGHVHTHKFYGSKFRYLGPVTRWEFGTNTEVGVTYIEYDTESKKVIKDEFIENKRAPKMPTTIINLMNKDNYEISEINDMIDDKMAELLADGASKIRFIVNLNSELSNASAIKDFLVTKIGEIPIAKLVLSNDFDKEVINNMKEAMEIERNGLDYIYNRNIDVEEQIKNFIKTHFNKDISVDKIKEYLEMEE